MWDERDKYYPLWSAYENKAPLPSGLRPFYHVVVRDAEELRRAESLKPPYVDATFSFLHETCREQSRTGR